MSSPYLSRPTPNAVASSSTSSSYASVSSSSSQKPDRLYIGNLSPTVDELTLIQIFGKFGKIAKMDFLFHKSGVLRGKPRGFAFVEFVSKDDALKAMVKLHDKPLRGRKLVVTYASQVAHEQTHHHTGPRRNTEAPKTTTLSLIKSQRAPKSAAAQIAALERKLAVMKESPLAVPSSAGNSPAAASVLEDAGQGNVEWQNGRLREEGEGGEEEGEGESIDLDGEMARLKGAVEKEIEESSGLDGHGVEGGKERDSDRNREHSVEQVLSGEGARESKSQELEQAPTAPKPTPKGFPGLPQKPSQAVIDSAMVSELVHRGRP